MPISVGGGAAGSGAAGDGGGGGLRRHPHARLQLLAARRQSAQRLGIGAGAGEGAPAPDGGQAALIQRQGCRDAGQPTRGSKGPQSPRAGERGGAGEIPYIRMEGRERGPGPRWGNK